MHHRRLEKTSFGQGPPYKSMQSRYLKIGGHFRVENLVDSNAHIPLANRHEHC